MAEGQETKVKMGWLEEINQHFEQCDNLDINVEKLIGNLIQIFGGKDLYIPYLVRKSKRTNRLKEVLGEKELLWLSKGWAGRRVYVPKKDKIGRNEQIRRDFFDGCNFSTLCQRYNLTKRRISGIVNVKEKPN